MLINLIHTDMLASKKIKDEPVRKQLLITLYSEASRVGKDKRNGESTDDEVISTVKKFVSNTEETIQLMEARGIYTHDQRKELAVLLGYLPKQMNPVELASAISEIVVGLESPTAKSMGKVMSDLKTKYGNTYDAKLASEMVKNILLK